MPPRLTKLWQDLRAKLWLRPILFVSVGIVLGGVLPAMERKWPALDAVLRGSWLTQYIPSTPDSSREVLGVRGDPLRRRLSAARAHPHPGGPHPAGGHGGARAPATGARPVWPRRV